MSAQDAADRFARGTGRKIPRGAALPRVDEEEAPVKPRRIAPEEENEPMLYPVERPAQGCAGFTLQALFLTALLGIVGVFAWWGMSTGRLDVPAASGQPLPTAIVPTRTALPTAPYAPPAASGGRTEQEPTVAPTSDYGIATYNAQQEQRATALAATQEGSGGAEAQAAPVDAEATAQAWLEGPASTPTMTPGIEQAVMDVAAVVVDAAFDATFEDAPACSPFVGYIGEDKVRCDAVFLEQTATAGE